MIFSEGWGLIDMAHAKDPIPAPSYIALLVGPKDNNGGAEAMARDCRLQGCPFNVWVYRGSILMMGPARFRDELFQRPLVIDSEVDNRVMHFSVRRVARGEYMSDVMAWALATAKVEGPPNLEVVTRRAVPGSDTDSKADPLKPADWANGHTENFNENITDVAGKGQSG